MINEPYFIFRLTNLQVYKMCVFGITNLRNNPGSTGKRKQLRVCSKFWIVCLLVELALSEEGVWISALKCLSLCYRLTYHQYKVSSLNKIISENRSFPVNYHFCNILIMKLKLKCIYTYFFGSWACLQNVLFDTGTCVYRYVFVSVCVCVCVCVCGLVRATL